jgi:hypothetical protein
VPPPFAASHSWVCPIWRWFHGQLTSPGATIFDSARVTNWATTTVLYVANSWSVPISIYVECYLSNGTLEPGVTVSGSVGAQQRLKSSLNPTRPPPMVAANGDFRDGGEGWFQLWANGPVTPAAMTLVIFAVPGWSPMELVVPVEPVEIEPAAVDVAPVHVEREAAPEGGAAASEASFETHLSIPEAVQWFESARSRRFHRDE